jgi:hypothetical protein
MRRELEPRRIVLPSLVVGIVGLLICVAGWVLDPGQLFRSYLAAYGFWLAVGLGLLGVALIQFLTGGVWGLASRRVYEAGASTLWVLAILFLPLFAGLYWLYPWARPEVVTQDPVLQHKAAYLNIPFFVVRSALYFIIWILIARLLLRWSAEQDRTGDLGLTARLQTFSTIGVIVLGLTASFAAIDWFMSLEPRWYSTVYGAMVAMGMVLTAFSFAVVVVILLSRREPLADVVTAQVRNELGSLLLAFLMLWTYMAFFQYLLIWTGNLTEEIPWYLNRLNGPWRPVALIVALAGFSLPFVLLVFRGLKRNPRTLLAIAAFLLATRLVVAFWLVMPAFGPAVGVVHWLDVPAILGIGGVWLAVFCRHLAARPVLPLHDPRLASVLELEHA